jgi:hypothetical protein
MNQDHIATPEEEEAFNMVEQQSNLGKQILRDMKLHEPVAYIGTNGELGWLQKPKVLYSAPIALFTHPSEAYDQGIQEGMKRERALWQMQAEGQKIDHMEDNLEMIKGNLSEKLDNALEALEIGHEAAAELAEDFHIRNEGFQPARHDWYDRQVEMIDKARKEFEQIIKKMKDAPPECQTEGEKTAYAFGWYKALEVHRLTIDESAAKRIATVLGWEPKREWVGLTDEEILGCKHALDWTAGWRSYVNFSKAIEAALKDKNT